MNPLFVLVPPNTGGRRRYQLMLDMSNPLVVEYLYHTMSNILRANHIEYVKWDLDRSICDWYSNHLPQGRQMEMPHRDVLGLYELPERLTRDLPKALFGGCSGGGRFDHVSAVPNHQTGRQMPLRTRGIVAMAGSFGYELDVNRFSDEDKNGADTCKYGNGSCPDSVRAAVEL